MCEEKADFLECDGQRCGAGHFLTGSGSENFTPEPAPALLTGSGSGSYLYYRPFKSPTSMKENTSVLQFLKVPVIE